MQKDSGFPVQISGGDFMKDDEKPREQLIHELKELRSQNAALEKTYRKLEVTKISESEALEYAESIINTIHEPLIVLDPTLKVIKANHSFYDFFKVIPEETLGKFIYDLGNKQWDIPELRKLLERILPDKTTFNKYEVEHYFHTIGTRFMLLNAREVQRILGKEKIILLAIEDVTELKRLEGILVESEYIFRRTYETANDAIFLLEKLEGRIAHANPAAEKMLGYTEREIVGKMLYDIGVKIDGFDIKRLLQTLDMNGIINYSNVPIKPNFGQRLAADIYIVNKATLLQCNIRDITKTRQATDLLEETNRALVGREMRIIELKTQIAALENKLSVKGKM